LEGVTMKTVQMNHTEIDARLDAGRETARA